MADNKQIATDVLAAVGGKENVTSVAHCMTRLRFNVKDMAKVDQDAVKKVKGVIGAQESGGQYQVIIGQTVPKVYEELCNIGGFAASAAIDENLDAPAEKLTLKRIGQNIMNYVSGSVVALIPILMAGGLFKCVGALIGPLVFNLVPETDPTYQLFYTYLYDACMYFLPIYLGYTAAKKIGATPVLGMLMGGILVCPDIVALANEGEQIVIYGVTIDAASYAQTVLPILLCVAALYWVEKLVRKIIPDVFSTAFVPFITMAIMVPIAYLALAPLGNVLGGALSAFLYAVADMGGLGFLFACAFVGGFWQLIVLTGMHMAIIMPSLVTFLQDEQDSFIWVVTNVSMLALWGSIVAAFFRIHNKEEKALTLSYLVSAVLGGVAEPALFGLMLRFKRFIPCIIAGGAAGSVVAGLTHLTIYMPGAMSNFLFFVPYLVGGTANLIKMIAAFGVAFIVGGLTTYFFGFSKEELDALDTEKTGEVSVA